MNEEEFNDLDYEIERIVEEEENNDIGPDEAVEVPDVEKARDVKPKKVVLNPRLKLDDKRLKGPRGLSQLEPLFKQVTLKGKGYEVRDLNTVMSVLEHWCHRLFPKMTFDDCLERIEFLGHKKSVSSYVTLLRMGMNDDDVVAPPRSPSPVNIVDDVDPFDQLLSSQNNQQHNNLSNEQKERMERNRLLAQEKRLANMKAKYDRLNKPENLDTNVELSSEVPEMIQ